MKIILLIKSNLIKQTRSRSFLLILLTSVFLGWLCVPAATDGYEIFYLGGVRGIYNSAWLGTIAALLSTILLWLPGFYLLRNQVSEDKRLKIGQILAATPVTRLQYIAGKVLSNFIVLCLLELLFLASFLVMQIIRGEALYISLFDYLQPFLVVTVPYLLVLAALTVLFDVFPGLMGAFGNVLIFIFWVTMTTLSVAMPENPFDLFAIGKILQAMTKGARSAFPNIPAESGSFGFYTHTDPTPTFEWDGVSWDSSFLLSRLVWIGVSVGICVLASLVFDRFRKEHSEKNQQTSDFKQVTSKRKTLSTKELPTVSRRNTISFASIIKGEARILTGGLSKRRFLLLVAALILSWVTPLTQMRWGSCILLIPISVWSKEGCDKKQYFTKELLASCGYQSVKWWASWLVGLFIAYALSAGVIIRYLLAGEVSHALAWLVGAAFIPTLALALGTLSESSRFFEAVYIVWFYMGCINNMGVLDFLGIAQNNTLIYFIATVVLLVLGRCAAVWTENAGEKRRIFISACDKKPGIVK